MADSTQTFKILLQVVSQLGGLQQLTAGVQNTIREFQGINAQMASLAGKANAILGAVGLGLGIRELEEYGRKALEVGEQQAAFNRVIRSGKEGSQEFVKTLGEFNESLEKTTGTSPGTARGLEQLFSRAGATQEQIKGLTKGVIEFAASSAGTVQPTELAIAVSKKLGGAADGADISFARFGLHSKDVAGALVEMNTRGAGAAEAMVKASGGFKVFQIEVEHAQVEIGRLFNLLQVPFFTGLAPQIESATKSMKDMRTEAAQTGHEFDTFGGKLAVIGSVAATVTSLIGSSFKGLADILGIAAGSVVLLVESIMRSTAVAILKLVQGAIDSLGSLARAAGSLLSFVPGIGGEIGKGFLGAADGIDKAAASVGGFADKTDKAFGGIVANVKGGVKEAVDDLAKTGANIFVKIEESLDNPNFWNNLRDKVRALSGEVTGDVKQGSGVSAAPPDTKGAAKAAAEALTAAKFQLTEAEQNYKTALEETKLVEDAGMISHDEATRRNIQATKDYIAQLEKIKSALPELISRFQAMGNIKGVAELKTELGQVTNKLLEAKIALQGQTFFGQILTQTRQLANEWGNLGKQIGGFLTQQFQNFASGASAAITSLIFRTGNWRQAILQLGQSFVQSLLQMVIQWVLSRTIMSALNKAFGAADQAAAAAQASAAAAAWAPAATAASIASYGVASGLGLTAYLAAIAAGTAGTVGAAAGGGGLAEGGRIPGAPSHVDNIWSPMATGEAVISARNVQRFDARLGRGFVDSLIVGKVPGSGLAGGGRVNDSAAFSQFLSGGGKGNGDLHVFVYQNADDLRRAVLHSDASKKVIVDAVRGKRLEIG